MKSLTYALGILILAAGTASAAEYHIYRDYTGKIVITNLQPPSTARIVVTYELVDSPPGAALSSTIQQPAAAEAKEPEKAADTPAVVAPRADAPVVETPLEPKEIIIFVPAQRDRRWPDRRRGI